MDARASDALPKFVCRVTGFTVVTGSPTPTVAPIGKQRKESGAAIVQPDMAKAATAERAGDIDAAVLERARAGDHGAFRSLVSH